MRTFSLVAVLFCVAVSAQATIIFTDGFHGAGPGSFTTVKPPDHIGPWTVGGDSVDWIGGYWQPAAGDDGSIDLSGTNAGSLSTSLSTIAGHDYSLTFYLAGNPDGGPKVKEVQVLVGSLDQKFTFDTTNKNAGNMGWILETAQFTATANTVLTFKSLQLDAYGPALDLVTVSDAVPEPASYTYGLLGLAGIGLSFIRRRR